LKLFEGHESFLLVAYSFGSLLALKAANLLESRGKNGSVVMIDGSPIAIKENSTFFFANKTDEEISIQICSNYTRLLLPDHYEVMMKKLASITSIDSRIKFFGESCEKSGFYSASYSEKMLVATMNRVKICLAADKVEFQTPIKASMSLIKPKSSILINMDNDYGLGKLASGEVKVNVLEGNHITILDNPKLAKIINASI
jgi:fatty acid synthase, animal type